MPAQNMTNFWKFLELDWNLKYIFNFGVEMLQKEHFGVKKERIRP